MVESAAVIYFCYSQPQRRAFQNARPLVTTQESTKMEQGSSKGVLDKEQLESWPLRRATMSTFGLALMALRLKYHSSTWTPFGFSWTEPWVNQSFRETSVHCWSHWTSGFALSNVNSVQSLRLFATPWTAACQASLCITNSRSLLKLMSIESVMPSNHLILCVPFSSCPQSFPASGSFPVS